MSSNVDIHPDDHNSLAKGTQLSPYDSPELPAEDQSDVGYEAEAAFGESDAYDQYRSLSIAAVTSLVFGVLSLLLLPVIPVAGVLLIVPSMGAMLGLFATWTITARPDEFTGRRIAIAGLALSITFLLLGAFLNYYLNKIEVPPQYADSEVYFSDLQPEDVDIDLDYIKRMRGRLGELPLPEKAKSLDGQKVFITGYVYPGDQKTGLDKFVLVRDKGSCCFGGQPKLTDMIEVKLADPLRIDYSMWRRGVGGTLRVHKQIQSRESLTGVIYQLEADYLSEGPGITGSADES